MIMDISGGNYWGIAGNLLSAVIIWKIDSISDSLSWRIRSVLIFKIEVIVFEKRYEQNNALNLFDK
jgi:hypothetical protein